jgi:hypothetical protein
MISSTKLAAAIAVGAMLTCSGSAAYALSYTTSGSATQFSLGDTLSTASNYDILQVWGTSGTIGPGTSTIALNELIFTAGPNAIVPATYNFSFTENVTIGTGTGTLVVPFSLSINSADTLSIAGGTTFSIPVGSAVWNIVLNGLTMGPNGGGSEIGFLTAQVSDPPAAAPVPAAFLLFGSGLGAIELLRRRKKAWADAVSAV